MVIVVLEITISITAYRSRANLESFIESDMLESMYYYPTDTKYIWSASQYNLRCCGVNGPSDWDKFTNKDGYNLSSIYPDYYTTISTEESTSEYARYHVPSSCCRQESCSDMRSLYKRGCLFQITFIISQSALLLGLGAMCITLIQILGAVFAHLLARSIRKLKTQIELERSIRRQELYESLSKTAYSKENSCPVLYVPSSSEA